MASHSEKEWSMEEVQNHFSDWRVKRPRPKQIPDTLWAEAVGLLSQHGLSSVVKALRLEGNSLKAKAKGLGVKVQLRTKGPAVKKTVKPTFLETNLATVGEDVGGEQGQGWKVSIKRSDGLEMGISGGGLGELALQELVVGFCGGKI